MVICCFLVKRIIFKIFYTGLDLMSDQLCGYSFTNQMNKLMFLVNIKAVSVLVIKANFNPAKWLYVSRIKL